MPRQNHRDHEGDVRDYAIEVSDDGSTWREIKRGALASTFDQQSIQLEREVTSKFLKLVALSGFGADKSTALGELAIQYTGPQLPESADKLEYKRVRSASTDIDEVGIVDEKKKK